jgi:hypothetical protein
MVFGPLHLFKIFNLARVNTMNYNQLYSLYIMLVALHEVILIVPNVLQKLGKIFAPTPAERYCYLSLTHPNFITGYVRCI